MAHPSRRNFPENPESENMQSQLHGCINQPCGGCSELAEAELQVAIAQNHLDTVRKRLARAKTNLNLWHDRLVARLPPEIVSQIFIIFSKNHQLYTYRSLFKSLLLARVCQRWRNIALTTPQLWTDIEIDIWKDSAQPEITQDLLSRSRSLPLSLLFFCVEGLEKPSPDSILLDPLINTIRSHSARWKYLDLNYAGIGNLSPLLIPKLLHNLEDIPNSDCLELHLGFVDCLRPIALPKPLRPRVFQSRLKAHSTNIPLQWDNLTYLDVGYLGLNDVLVIVHEAPRLIDLTADRLHIQAHPFPITPIIHHCLKKLTLEFDVDDGDILRHLTLPSLRCLDCVLGLASDATIVIDVLMDFLNRSDLKPGSLQTFRLQYDLEGEDYNHRFVELAAVTSLEIQIHSPDLLYTYLCELSEPSTLPRLRHIAINMYGESPSPASWALLSDLCQDRTVSARPSLGETTSGQNIADTNGSSGAQINSTESILASGAFERRYSNRTLESLTVEGCARPDISTMEQHVLARFLEIQRAGVVKLVFRDDTDTNSEDDDVLMNLAKIYDC